MRQKAISPLLLLALVLCQSCETYRVTPITANRFEPTDPEKVEIFITDVPEREYTEIGTVSVRTINSYFIIATTRSPEQANAIMREKAASIGGDAVIGYREEFQEIKGTVIKYVK